MVAKEQNKNDKKKNLSGGSVAVRVDTIQIVHEAAKRNLSIFSSRARTGLIRPYDYAE